MLSPMSPILATALMTLITICSAAAPFIWGWRLSKELDRTRRMLEVESEMRKRWQREAWSWREMYPDVYQSGKKTTVWRQP